ncbi:NAD(P)H-dependent oxidoreductase [Roseomonas sp. OT10]|uniref:NADPH-dependent FMN reductase n=1 Tax=Roseomonas cutis TaxID=2897332 RepID=UPI001E6366CB|nr:NADPH-dependent FMN reductase [Roseomonas sp. OT10]UFN50142.1 NAD(P)H-dependent oxidoreductase [Roseomonas sp. OT10]
MALKLNIVIASTRPGRIGPKVADWFDGYARAHGGFDPVLVDLATFDLPVYDEPKHPRMQQYQHAHTKAWSESVASADAFVFVTPEYNFFPPPSLVNALNYVYSEWNYKPAGFVSYGGASGGLRSVQAAKLLVTTLKMMPMVEGVMVPMVAKAIGEDGRMQSNPLIDDSATSMLDEMLRWAEALKPMRAKG